MADQLQGAVDKAKSFKVQDLTTYVRNLTKDPPTLATVQPRVLEGIQACISLTVASIASLENEDLYTAIREIPCTSWIPNCTAFLASLKQAYLLKQALLCLQKYKAQHIDPGSIRPLFHVMWGVFFLFYAIGLPGVGSFKHPCNYYKLQLHPQASLLKGAAHHSTYVVPQILCPTVSVKWTAVMHIQKNTERQAQPSVMIDRLKNFT